MSGTYFLVFSTLLYLYEHCLYIKYCCFFKLPQFYNNSTKILDVNKFLQHSYCNIVFLIIQFRKCLFYFFTTFKGFIFIIFWGCFFVCFFSSDLKFPFLFWTSPSLSLYINACIKMLALNSLQVNFYCDLIHLNY